MSTQKLDLEEYEHEVYWPTTAWLEKFENELTASEELDKKMAGWGQGFNGDFVFEIRNLPITDNTVGDLPDEVWQALDMGIRQLPEEILETVLEDAPEVVQEGIESREGPLPDRAANELLETRIIDSPDRVWPGLRRVMPEVLEFLLEQLEDHVTEDGHVYAWIGLEDGDCTGTDTLMDLEEKDKGFVLTGEYPRWVELVTGELDVVEGIMAGKFELDGDMQKILQYTDAQLQMTDIAAETEKRFLF
jgi:putative sterol carrier protein